MSRRALVGVLVGLAALAVAAVGPRSCDAGPAPTPADIADRELADVQDRATSSADGRVARADSLGDVHAARRAELADVARRLRRQAVTSDSLLTALRRDLHALPPDSLAARAAAECRARGACR